MGVLTIVNKKFYVGGTITHPGSAAEGMLLNTRLIQATADYSAFASNWDPDANTQAFIDMLPVYKSKGMNSFTVGTQGGNFGPSPAITGNEYDQGAFNSNGSLRSAHVSRLIDVLDAAIAIDMVPMVNIFYFRTDQVLSNETAVIAAVNNLANALSSYKNYIIFDVVNEATAGSYNHSILRQDRAHELVDDLVADGWFASFSLGGGQIPTTTQAGDSNVILLHSNNQLPAGPNTPGIASQCDTAKSRFPNLPIIINESGPAGDYSQFPLWTPEEHVAMFEIALSKGVSYGYHDGENFQYATSPNPVMMDWSLNHPIKAAMFDAFQSAANVSDPGTTGEFGDYVQGDAASSNGATSLSVTLSADPKPGNLLFIIHSTTATKTPTPGWNTNGWENENRLQTTQTNGTVWWKISNGGEGRTFSVENSSAGDHALSIVEFAGPFEIPITTDATDHMDGGQGDEILISLPITTTKEALIIFAAAYSHNTTEIVSISDGFVKRVQSPPAADKYFGTTIASLLSGSPVTNFSPTMTANTLTSESTWLGFFYGGAVNITGDQTPPPADFVRDAPSSPAPLDAVLYAPPSDSLIEGTPIASSEDEPEPEEPPDEEPDIISPEYTIVVSTRVPQEYGPPVITEIGELTPVGPISYTNELNWEGEASLSVDPEHVDPEVAWRLSDLKANPLEITIYRDDAPIWIGPIISCQLQGFTLTINARGLLYYSRYMQLESTLEFKNVDVFSIVREMFNHYQSLRYGDYGISIGATNVFGDTATRTYDFREDHNVFQRVGELSDIFGFHFWVDIARNLQLSMNRGSNRTLSVYVDVQNIVNPNVFWSISAEEFGTRAIAAGMADGIPSVVGKLSDEPGMSAFGRATMFKSAEDVTKQSTIDRHATELLDSVKEMIFQPGPSVASTKDVNPMTVTPGDRINFEMEIGNLGVVTSQNIVSMVRTTTDEDGLESMEIGFL